MAKKIPGWMDGGPMDDDEDDIGPGEVVDKKRLCQILGLTAYAVSQLIARGLPVLHRGSKLDPWKFEVGTVSRWIIADAVRNASDDSTPAARYRTAKTRKMQAEFERLRDANHAMRSQLITVDEAVAGHREQAAILRKHLGAFPAAVMAAMAGLKPEDRRDASFVETLIADMLNAAMAAICAANEGGVQDHVEAA